MTIEEPFTVKVSLSAAVAVARFVRHGALVSSVAHWDASDQHMCAQTMVRNVARLKAVIMSVVNLLGTMDGLFKWEYGFVSSFTAMTVSLIACACMYV